MTPPPRRPGDRRGPAAGRRRSPPRRWPASAACGAGPDPFGPIAVRRGQAARGGALAVGGQVGNTAIRLVGTVVLARLLTPADFGLLAMVTIVTGFVGMFTEVGLSAATVQREEITRPQVSSLFWLNLALGTAAGLVTAALAPALAWLYGRPELVGITLALACTFPIAGATVQHMALMRRQLRFATLTGIAVSAAAATTIVSVAAGLAGWGVWALVAGSLASPGFTLLLCLTALPWRPGGPSRDPADRAAVREMLGFGANLGASQVMVYVRRNLDSLLIGAAYGPAVLGLYNKSYQLLSMAVSNVNTPISQIVQPCLARLKDEPAAFRRFYRRAVFATAGLSLPLVAFAATSAELVVGVVLGPQWLEAVPLFLALAPAALVSAVSGISSWAFLPYGRANAHFRVQIFASVAIIGGILAGLPFGPLWVAAGFAAGYLVAVPTAIHVSLRGTVLRWSDVLGAAAPSAAAAAVACGAVLAFAARADLEGLPGLIARAALFGTVYAAVHLLMPTRRVWLEPLRDALPARLRWSPGRGSRGARRPIRSPPDSPRRPGPRGANNRSCRPRRPPPPPPRPPSARRRAAPCPPASGGGWNGR